MIIRLDNRTFAATLFPWLVNNAYTIQALFIT